LGCIIFVCLFGAAFYLTPTEFDSNNCRKGEKNSVTALLIDASDSLSNAQKAELQSQIKNLTQIGGSRKKAFLGVGDRLAVYVLGEDGAELDPIFDGCNPGSPEERSVVEIATEGAMYARARWLDFNRIMAEVEEKVVTSTPKGTSPIIEAIKMINAEKFPPSDLITESSRYRLIIASDFLQNSSTTRHYNGLENVESVHKKNPIDFGGAEVYFWRLNSKSHLHLQTPKHLKWWREFFALSNARLQKPLQF